MLGRLIRGLWKIACSWALIFSACLRYFLALRMAGTPLRSRWAAFLCHTSYLEYFTVTCCFLETSYCGVQAKMEEKEGGGKKKRGSEYIRSDKTLCKKCLLQWRKALFILRKHSVIVGPVKWKSNVILIAPSVITDSPRLRLAPVLVSWTEGSCQQVLGSASLTYCQREGRPLASYSYEGHVVVHPTTR